MRLRAGAALWAGSFAIPLAGATVPVEAAPLTPGNIVIYRIGDGTTSPSSNAAAVSIVEYTPTGSLVQTFSMPTSGATAFTNTGNSTSDGGLQFSANGQYLLFQGYRRDVGQSAPDGQSATTTNRLFARMDLAGNIDASTAATMPNQIRWVASTDGSEFWVSNSQGTPRYLAYQGTGNGTILLGANTGAASRQVSIYDNTLYASITSSNPGSGIYTFDNGLPTTTGQAATKIIDGLGITFQSFFAADLDAGVAGVDTIWGVDTTANTIRKYSKVAGTWTSNGSLAAGGMQYITGVVTDAGVLLYGSQPLKVSTLTDSSGYNGVNNGTVTDIAGLVPGTLRTFRAVAVVVPEPGSLAVLGLAAVGCLARRRRQP